MELLESDLKHLFVTWMEESAVEATLKNSRSALGIGKALDKLRKETHPIQGPKDLLKIQFFGEKRVQYLTKKLNAYCKEEGYKLPEAFATPKAASAEQYNLNNSQSPLQKRSNSSATTTTSKKSATAAPKKKYVPTIRSGAYAILIVLVKYDRDRNGLTKDEIISKAGPYCDKSFNSNPSTSQFYSAWNSCKTLMKRDLVKGSGRPMYYYLTDEGLELADMLIRVNEGESRPGESVTAAESRTQRKENQTPAAASIEEYRRKRLSASDREKRSLSEFYDDEKEQQKRKRPQYRDDGIPQNFEADYDGGGSDFATGPACDPFSNNQEVSQKIWQPGSFDIKLVIDNREIRSREERAFFSNKLTQLGLKTDIQPLAVGDLLWTAKHKVTGDEVVLDFIVERKRLDDLVESIRDGRFLEQKSRLAKTGMKNIYYLIEEQTGSDLSNFVESIKTSISLVLLGSKYFVRRSKDADETAHFLALLTKSIEKHYLGRSLMVIRARNLKGQNDYKITLQSFCEKYPEHECCFSFGTFQTMLNKSNLITVKEIYVRMLMTTRGVSLERALAIQKFYPTPKSLVEAYMALGDDEKAKKLLLKNATENEVGNRSLGIKLSENVHANWGR